MLFIGHTPFRILYIYAYTHTHTHTLYFTLHTCMLFILYLSVIRFVHSSLYLLILSILSLPYLSPLVSISLSFVSMSLFMFLIFIHFTFLDSTYKWNHTAFIFLIWLIKDILQVHSCCCKWQNFILSWLCSRVRSHILFIQSSVGGCLSCFHTLAIINNASMNIALYISFLIFIFFICILRQCRNWNC